VRRCRRSSQKEAKEVGQIVAPRTAFSTKAGNCSDRTCVYTVMPIDAAKKITPENCVVVTLETRRRLIRFVDENDLEAYAQMIAEICTRT